MTQEKELTQRIIEGIQEKKGTSITLVDLHDIDIVASAQEFIICTGNSTSQVSAIAESVIEYVAKNANTKPFNYDGFQNSQWIVIDYGTIYVHVFLKEWREFYNLEELWNDAKITEIPDLY